MKNTLQKSIVALSALLALGAGAGITALASAQSLDTDTAAAMTSERRGPGVMGEVTAVSGNTVTVKDERSGTTYTVDVSSAKVMVGQEGAAPTQGVVSDIEVGDTIGARGTVSGTTVTATEVMTGDFLKGGPGMHGGRGVHGTISSISGTSVTITNTDGTSYTVDASDATVSKTVDISVSDLAVGDEVGVMGEVSGTSVDAEHIMSGAPFKIKVSNSDN